MSKLLFTRFTKIYGSREEAISRLDETSRYYAENVSIRYVGENDKIEVILALYMSERKGDYRINYDSGVNIDNEESNTTIINTGVKVLKGNRNVGENNSNAAYRLYGNTPPVDGDMAIIHNTLNDSDTLMVFIEGSWEEIESANNQTMITAIDSETIDLTINKIDTSQFTIKANVPIDRESLEVGPDGKISVVEIDGGNL